MRVDARENENISLPDAILKNKYLNESVVVFDRGLQTRKVFNEFTNKNILFIGRIKTDVSYKLIRKMKHSKKQTIQSVELIEDIEVQLYSEYKLTENTFRIIKLKIKASNEELFLISNII